MVGIDPNPNRRLQREINGQKNIGKVEPMAIINKARTYTVAAVEKLVNLMNGELPDGSEGMVPPAVQLRAAELLIERGYGKAPQAIMLKDDTAGPNVGSIHAIPILERIAQLQAARDAQGTVTDLEASELTVIDETYINNSPVSNKTQQPEDII